MQILQSEILKNVVSNKVAHLSNKEHSSIAKVSLCPFVPADVSEVMINYKSKRKEVSDAGKQSKQFQNRIKYSRTRSKYSNNYKLKLPIRYRICAKSITQLF